jgi:hypothetical protein
MRGHASKMGMFSVLGLLMLSEMPWLESCPPFGGPLLASRLAFLSVALNPILHPSKGITPVSTTAALLIPSSDVSL